MLPESAATLEPSDRMTAGWAMWAKHAGRTMDYAIIAGSLDATTAEAYVGAGLTGHPDDPAPDRPEALPWLSFVAGPNGDPSCAVLELGWSDIRDGTGQIVAPIRILLVDWPGMAARRVGYVELAAALGGLEWHRADAGPIGGDDSGVPVAVPAPDSTLITHAVDQRGFEWCAGVAALLLEDRQVVLVDPDGALPGLMERLQLLDMICALLPYAVRARLSVGTWAMHRIAHHVRLTFAERARDGQVSVHLRGLAPAPAGVDARAYLATALQLRDSGYGTEQIVQYLAGQGDPRTCRTAQDATTVLRELDLQGAVLAEIRAGRGDPERVGWVLERGGWGALRDDAMRRAYATFLTGLAVDSRAGQRGVDLLRRFWTPVVGAVAADAAYRGLMADRIGDVSILADAAGTDQARWAFARELTQRVAARPDPHVLAAYRRCGLGELVQPEMLRIFCGYPDGLRALITDLADEPDILRRVVGTWPPDLGEQLLWLQPLIDVVQEAPERTGAAPVAAMRREWPEGALVGLQYAAWRGRPWPAVRASWSILVGLAADIGRRPAAVEHFLRCLRLVGEARVPPDMGAYLDLLFLTLNGTLPALAHWPDVPDEYVDALRAGWATPELDTTALVPRLSSAVLGTNPAAGSYRQLTVVVNAVAPQLMPQVARDIRGFLDQHPRALHELALDERWSHEVGGWVHHLHQLAALCASSASGRDVYQPLAELLRSEFPHDDLLSALGPWLRPENGDQIVELCYHLESSGEPMGTFVAVLLERLSQDRSGGFDRYFYPYLPDFAAYQRQLTLRYFDRKHGTEAVQAPRDRGWLPFRSKRDHPETPRGDLR